MIAWKRQSMIWFRDWEMACLVWTFHQWTRFCWNVLLSNISAEPFWMCLPNYVRCASVEELVQYWRTSSECSKSLSFRVIRLLTREQFIFVRTNITRTDVETEMVVYIPEVLVEGFYKAEGRFNNLRIKSKGFFNITASKNFFDFFFTAILYWDIIFSQLIWRWRPEPLANSKSTMARSTFASVASTGTRLLATWKCMQLAFCPIQNWVSAVLAISPVTTK